MSAERAQVPDGINPTVVPPIERLEELTDAEVYACVRWWATENFAIVGMEFWIDELSRRRTQRVLDDIAAATAEDARQVQRLTELVAEGAAQNREAARLNRRMFALAMVNLAFAAAAVVIAAIATFAL